MVSQEDHLLDEKVCDAPESAEGLDGNNEAEGWNPTINQDDLILRQQEKIIEEIAAESPDLVGERISLDQLLTEYSEDQDSYRSKILDLKKSYDSMRKTRPDGNCFFRAFGFSLFHSLLKASSTTRGKKEDDEIDRLKAVADRVKEDLYKLGFTFTVDEFYDNFVEALQEIKEGKISSPEVLRDEIFNNNSRSDYMVVFLRLVTSAHLQLNQEFFGAFIENGLTVKDFCQTEVEPMAKESDHIHVIAITEAMGVGVRINYLDRGGCLTKVNTHDFPEGIQDPKVHLLYRPGHYDVLYRLNFVTTNDSSESLTSSTASSTLSCDVSSSMSAHSSTQPSVRGRIRHETDDVSSSNNFSASNASFGVSSSKNPRLDPSVSSSSFSPSSTVTNGSAVIPANGEETTESADEGRLSGNEPSTTS